MLCYSDAVVDLTFAMTFGGFAMMTVATLGNWPKRHWVRYGGYFLTAVGVVALMHQLSDRYNLVARLHQQVY